jgi:hypothetical protein
LVSAGNVRVRAERRPENGQGRRSMDRRRRVV